MDRTLRAIFLLVIFAILKTDAASYVKQRYTNQRDGKCNYNFFIFFVGYIKLTDLRTKVFLSGICYSRPLKYLLKMQFYSILDYDY